VTALDGFIIARRDGSLHCVAVDPADFDRVEAAGPWYVLKRPTFYVWHRVQLPEGKKGSLEYLHRFILGLEPGDGLEVDHRDGNGLNNTRANMVVCTRKENRQNLHRPGHLRGVSWDKWRQKWQAQVQADGHGHHLGYFNDKLDAARAAEAGRAKYFTHHNEERHPVPSA
jgi:hypothetical protein